MHFCCFEPIFPAQSSLLIAPLAGWHGDDPWGNLAEAEGLESLPRGSKNTFGTEVTLTAVNFFSGFIFYSSQSYLN